jgi:hypothetical protein
LSCWCGEAVSKFLVSSFGDFLETRNLKLETDLRDEQEGAIKFLGVLGKVLANS